MAEESVIRPNQLKAVTGISRSTAWRLEQKGKFPKRIVLSERAVGWLRSEVDAWLVAKKAVA